MASLTLIPTKVPEQYFGIENVEFVKQHVTDILSYDFESPIVVDDASVLRVLHRVLDERLEPLSKMLTRAIMEIVNEIKTFELERIKNLRLEKYYEFGQKIYDVSTRAGPDMQHVKLSKQPSTLRFYHTYGT